MGYSLEHLCSLTTEVNTLVHRYIFGYERMSTIKFRSNRIVTNSIKSINKNDFRINF